MAGLVDVGLDEHGTHKSVRVFLRALTEALSLFSGSFRRPRLPRPNTGPAGHLRILLACIVSQLLSRSRSSFDILSCRWKKTILINGCNRPNLADKYCPLLEKERGLERLQPIINDEIASRIDTKNLVQRVMRHHARLVHAFLFVVAILP